MNHRTFVTLSHVFSVIAVLTWLGQGSAIEVLSGPSFVAQAKARWMDIGAAEVERTRGELLEQMRVARDMLVDLPEGNYVMRVTGFGDLHKALDQGTGELADLQRIYRLMARSVSDDAQRAVDDVRRKLLRHQGAWEWSRVQDPRNQFDRHVEAIGAALGKSALTRDEFAKINEHYGWLAKSGRVDDLLVGVRRQLSHPNKQISIHREFIAGMVAHDIHKVIPISQNSGGATIRGTATVDAKPDVQLIPNEQQGQFHVVVNGGGRIPLTISKHPATLSAQSDAKFNGLQMLYVTDQGIDVGDHHVDVRAQTSVTGVCLQTRSRLLNRMLAPLVERIAQKKAGESDRQIESQARSEIEKQLTEASYAVLAQFNGLLNRILWTTIDARDVDPQVDVTTTGDELRWVAEFITPTELGAWRPPLSYGEQAPPIQMKIQESSLSNISTVFANKRFNEVLYQEVVFGNFHLHPEDDVKSPGGRFPAAFTFGPSAPMTLTIDHNRVTFVWNITGFEFDGQTYPNGPPRRITAAYQIEPTDERVWFVRQGPIQLEPAGAPDEALCRQALERFLIGKAWVNRSVKTKLPGMAIYLSHVIVDQGWFQLGMSPRRFEE